MIVTFKHQPTGQINGLSAVKGSSIDQLKNYVRLHFRRYEMYSANGVFRVIIHSKDYNKYCSLVLWYESNCEYISSEALDISGITKSVKCINGEIENVPVYVLDKINSTL